MKPHTRIIYYTLLCLALNHRRSRAHIYGEGASMFLFAYLFAPQICVCLCANICLHEHVFFSMVCGICRIC